MSSRIQEYEKDTVVVDGMLKSSDEESNTYSEYSRKGKIKGSKDINLIYAYDIKNEEPLACTPYAGNMLDYTAFEDFIKTYPIKNGFIILDKGFDDEKTVKENLRKLETKFLVPIKNTSKVIKEYKLDNDFQDCFKYEQDNIRCKKIKVNDNKYYYAFKSSEAKSMQDKGYIARNLKKGAFNETAYNKKENLFGLIVFESNYDGKLKDIYDAYQRRWEIEILFSKYKNLISRTEENVHGTYRLMSTEFINFISCIMVSRIKKVITKSKEASKYSLPKIMRLLSKCTKKRATKNPENWVDSAMLKYVKELCLDLGI